MTDGSEIEDDVIDAFWGPFRFLSNFWPAIVEFEGQRYPSVEHAYQASKTTNPTIRRRIRSCATAGAAKAEGSAITPPSGWSDTRLDVMRGLLVQKFSTEPLRSQLLSTREAFLIEGNSWHDTFWGVYKGDGENHLGFLLMEIRRTLARDL